jgi:cation:H+ antiporter
MDTWLQIAAGLALLTVGGEGVIRGTLGIARRLALSELPIGLVPAFGAIDIARRVGLSEAVIGPTIVAVGTALPELAASPIAAIFLAPYGLHVGWLVAR